MSDKNKNSAVSASGSNSNKRVLLTRNTHTGDTVKTTIYSLTIPAGFISAGSVISIRPQFEFVNNSTFNTNIEVAINAAIVLSISTTSKSFNREQEVYIIDQTSLNNTKNRNAGGTSDQEGVINSNLAQATVDWTQEQTLVISTTLGGATDSTDLIGGYIDFIRGSDTLE